MEAPGVEALALPLEPWLLLGLEELLADELLDELLLEDLTDDIITEEEL